MPNKYDAKEHIVIVGRYVERFLCEMKRCSIEGSTTDERVDIAKTYLANIERLPNGPLLMKLKELFHGFIDGTSRHLESFVNDQVAESRDLGTEWLCSVCGKRNRDTKKKYVECITCGKAKGYVVSKKLKRLNDHRIDPTPHLTKATKDELKSINYPASMNREKWRGEEGKESFFVSMPSDYEAQGRSCIKSEINDVLSSIRQSLDEI